MVIAIATLSEETRLKVFFGKIYFLRVRLTAEPKNAGFVYIGD
jgi:hypothetical protein